MTTSTARQPKGIPVGGQFAATTHHEPSITLDGQAERRWDNTEAIRNLNTTQRRSVAASLEIDGRADVAATAGVTGHITEFQHRDGEPYSPKAKQQESLRLALESAIAADGVDRVVAALRSDVDPDVAPTKPWRPYELTENSDGTFTYNEAGAETNLEHKQPSTRTDVRRALRCPRSRGRVVDLVQVPGRRNSTWDDVYEVAGPESGAPLVIRVQEGFHRLHVQSGNVHIEVLDNIGGGTLVEDGAAASVVVDGSNEYTVETRGSASARIALSTESRVEVRAAGKGAMYVTGGGPGCAISARVGATVHQDGNELNQLPVLRPKIWY